MRTPTKNFLNTQYRIVIYPTQTLPDNSSVTAVTQPTEGTDAGQMEAIHNMTCSVTVNCSQSLLRYPNPSVWSQMLVYLEYCLFAAESYKHPQCLSEVKMTFLVILTHKYYYCLLQQEINQICKIQTMSCHLSCHFNSYFPAACKQLAYLFQHFLFI